MSIRRLKRLNKLPSAKGPWAIDSGGFSDLSLHGMWTMTTREYIAEVRRCVECIGNVQWAAAMDWMNEPMVLKKTGLTVAEHQQRTLDNYKELLDRAPDLPWAPVIQGWSWGDYLRHAEAYQKAGIDLRKPPAVGVGSICRRQGTWRIGTILACLQDIQAKLHCFGLKTKGLVQSAEYIHSADSLAWSYAARKRPPLPQCPHAHCQNCLRFALHWRAKIMKLLGADEPARDLPMKPTLF